MPTLTRRFFATDAATCARALLGHHLVRTERDLTLTARIVATAAYLGPEDHASHAVGKRRTARNASMWARPGTAYVYMSHGLHACFNIATLREDHPAAVLIRAVEPIGDAAHLARAFNLMRSRRPKTRRDIDLTNGPGKLSQALAITIDDDGLDVTDPASTIRIERGRTRAIPDNRVVTTARIGLGKGAGQWASAPLRYRLADTRWASRDPRVTTGWPSGFHGVARDS